MTNFVGLNLSLTFPGDPNVAADHARRLNAAFHVLCTVGDAKRALEYANAMPNTTFIDRLVEDGDGGWWLTLTPQQMVDKIANREGRGKLVRYVLNEPGIANAAEDVADPVRRERERKRIDQFVAWCVEVLDKAAAIGERVCIGNLWAGTPHEYWIQSGAFDPLIRALDRHHNMHFLGLHEGQPFMVAGHKAITLDYDAMKDPAQMQESEWGDPTTTPTDNAWMVGRCWHWGERAIQIGCRPSRIVITEFTPAQNNQPGAQELYRWLSGKFGVAIGRFMDGIPTLLNAWTAYFGAGGAITLLRRMLAWVARFYPYNVVGLCIYCYNFQDVWREFNIGNLNAILSDLINNPVPTPTREYAAVAPPVDPPKPPAPVRLRVHAGVTRLRVRDEGSLAKGVGIVGYVSGGDVLTPSLGLDCVRPHVGKASEWIRITAPVNGYVSAEFVTIE